MQSKQEKVLYLKKQLGSVFKSIRNKTSNISCNKAEEEYDISRGNLNRLENGKTDPTFTTLWKAAEANGEKLSYIISLVENSVGEDFSLTD